MRVGMATHVGKVREVNEDSIGRQGSLLVLADGMGGHNAGEVASALVVERVLALEAEGSDFKAELVSTLKDANHALLEYASAHQECSGMGTTVVAVKIETERICVAHVGDSRVYHWHKGLLIQLTTDHSLVGELVRSGGITEEQAKNHPQRHILTRALGTPGDIEIEYAEYPLAEGDRLLLCSDGLTVMLSHEEIFTILSLDHSPQEIADYLVKAANEKGGTDNISVIVAFL
ncbi:MAG TPA: Stp1/IreP family PP2C-type Ser/Thr phosphatase [Firmicutes bacterium]|nr:Stp1/IreP family PP2C-type Ser/Thr phosphatase [Bacillota bacterium]HBT18144.1 Stp1/IreP family PP2C-type Ser/Thr phosphatase [Bacillota bacterium]